MGLRQPIIAVFIFNMSLSASVANDWDHFVFAQTWPPAVCVEAEHKIFFSSSGSGSVSVNDETSVYSTLRESTVCNIANKMPLGKGSVHMDNSRTLDLKESLLKYWPDLYDASDSLWAHEWARHGTCCMDLSTTSGEHNYFATGLSMNRKYDLLKILRESNVTPNDTAEYKVSDFVKAVEKAIGVTPHMSCSVHKENHKKFTLIGQVKICLKKDLTPMECPYEAEYPANKQNPSSALEDKLDMNENLGLKVCPLKFHYPPIKYV